jgi:16S rRNA U516 pseudouridylate synthase RsuA-like enzyme
VHILQKGMDTEALGKLQPARATIEGPRTIRITLREGKRHQIRIMLAELRFTVTALRRTRVGKVRLGALTPSSSRPLTPEEVASFGILTA